MGVSLYIRIKKTCGTRAYVPVAKSNNGKIKHLYALVNLVNSKPEYHPAGGHNLRVTVKGKLKWLPAGNAPAAATATSLRWHADRIEGITPAHDQRIAMPAHQPGLPAPPEAKQEHNLDEAIASYLAETRTGKAKRTHLVYKYTLEAFREVCTAPTVESIRREDVIAYIESPKDAGNRKRTIANHVMHLGT